jgi:hypothetical protein
LRETLSKVPYPKNRKNIKKTKNRELEDQLASRDLQLLENLKYMAELILTYNVHKNMPITVHEIKETTRKLLLDDPSFEFVNIPLDFLSFFWLKKTTSLIFTENYNYFIKQEDGLFDLTLKKRVPLDKLVINDENLKQIVETDYPFIINPPRSREFQEIFENFFETKVEKDFHERFSFGEEKNIDCLALQVYVQ